MMFATACNGVGRCYIGEIVRYSVVNYTISPYDGW